MPFIEEVTNNDAKGDRIGVVSWYSREGNKTDYSLEMENLKKAFEAYQKKKEEKAAKGKKSENWERKSYGVEFFISGHHFLSKHLGGKSQE